MPTARTAAGDGGSYSMWLSSVRKQKISLPLDLLWSWIHVYKTLLKWEWSGVWPGCKIWVGCVSNLKEQCPSRMSLCPLDYGENNLSKFSTSTALLDNLLLFLMLHPSVFIAILSKILILDSSVKSYTWNKSQIKNGLSRRSNLLMIMEMRWGLIL